MSNDGIVNIHGKEYMTVAKRVELAHEDGIDSILTEVLQHAPVVIKATVTIKGKTYTGISSANPLKAIEKSNPYEVAETSAVGRALGFAGYGIIEGIASADEMVKAEVVKTTATKPSYEDDDEPAWISDREEKPHVCSAHGEPVPMLRGVSKTKLDKDGNPKVYWWHKSGDGKICFGSGWQD